MIRKVISVITFLALGGISLAKSESLIEYVNPFVGTAYNGHTFPGPCMPFGFVQPSPETGNLEWKYTAGYNYDDKKMWFFSQTHISGTGGGDLGDVAFIPFTGSSEKSDFKSNFKKENEKAQIGLYSVYLDDAKAEVKISATERVAIYEIKFDADNGGLFFDFQSGNATKPRYYHNRVKSSDIKQDSPFEITGAQTTRIWVPRNIYFDIVFDKPIKNTRIVKAKLPHKGDKYILNFGLKKGDVLKVKIALSTVSVENAKANMQAELPDWNFDNVVAKNKATWERLLRKVKVKGSISEKQNFYTSMYHAFIHPSNICDVNGQYRGVKNNVAKSESGHYYSTLSIWDTYRALHPLMILLVPERVDPIINTMLAHFDEQGYLPIWGLWGKEAFSMIGNHSIAIIAEAYMKGFRGFDAKRALNAMVVSSTKKLRNSNGEIFEKYGYYPFDYYKNESVSRTLECCYDDYALSIYAKALGEEKLFERFNRRAGFYKNLFDSSTKLMRARDKQGNWRTPFDPLSLSHDSTMGGDYTEGNAYQYTYHVQHDVDGLIELFGGNKTFVEKLNFLFKNNETSTTQASGFTGDVSGFIGQYAHGNEPSHHIIYLFALAGEKWRTQELVREVFDKFYSPTPDGLCGNEDCGQMSAWYIFSAMGFYPVDPVSTEYVLGAPQLSEVEVDLGNNKSFKMIARNFSKDNKFVKSVKLNGKIINGLKIKHSDILQGGTIEFDMTSVPQK